MLSPRLKLARDEPNKPRPSEKFSFYVLGYFQDYISSLRRKGRLEFGKKQIKIESHEYEYVGELLDG